MSKELDTAVDNASNYIDEIVTSVFTEIVQNSVAKSYNEIMWQMYNTAFSLYYYAIEQFYTYETTSYIRHGTPRPGTKTGYNLHEANQTYAIWKEFNGEQVIVGFCVNINADLMAPYYQKKDPASGQSIYIKADYVLENVMEGIRGLNPDDVNDEYRSGSSQTWKAENLPTVYWGNISGTPNEMFTFYNEKMSKDCDGLLAKDIIERCKEEIKKINWKELIINGKR